jgi:hypothetical protein
MKLSKLQSLIQECIKVAVTQLTEGMDVGVADFKSGRRLDNLNDIAWYLLDTCIKPVFNALPPDQLEYFKKNGVPYHDMITPDGGYYTQGEGPTGTINFYISGFTSQALQKILRSIFAELRKLKIKWGHVRKESSGVYKSQVIRFPIVRNMNTYEGPPEMHMSNVNAYHIFHNLLQYEGEHGFTMDAEELIQRIDSLMHDKKWVAKNVRPTTVVKPEPPPDEGDEWKREEEPPAADDDDEENPHDKVGKQLMGKLGGTHYMMGMDEEGIWDRLHSIYKIAQLAVQHGYKRIDVG